jgi:CarD family transcriptional regulator
MYEIGDLVMYGNMGVCKLVAFKTGDQIGTGNTDRYYILEPLYQKCTVCVPVDSKQVFMRPIISKDEAEELIRLIPSMQTQTFYSSDQRILEEHYKARLKTHSCRDLIELTMSIYEKRQLAETTNRKVGVIDLRFMKLAEEQLFGELGSALGIDKESVPRYIATKIESSRAGHSKTKASLKHTE